MASIYKRSSNRNKRRSSWYIDYKDHDGIRRTRKGYTDKAETERLAAKLEEEARMIRDGLMTAPKESSNATVEEQFLNFEKHLRNRDVGSEQIATLTARIRRIAEECGWQRTSHIASADVEGYLSLKRSEGMSKQTSNHYVRAIKQFCRWLVQVKQLKESPVASIPMLNVETDRRRVRRPLSDEELTLLVAAAEEAGPIECIPGPDRAMMYILSAWTGYRKREIGSLTRHLLILKAIRQPSQFKPSTANDAGQIRRHSTLNWLNGSKTG